MANSNDKQTPENDEKKPKNKLFKKGATTIIDVLSSVKRVQFNYSENNGKVLPGYLPNVGFLGLQILLLALFLEARPMSDMKLPKGVG